VRSHYGKTKYKIQNTKYNIKINKTQIIHGLFDFISKIISNNINHNNLLLFYNIYVNLNYTKKNSHNPRVSKIPFTKWYIKEYQSKYEIEKIFNAYNSDDKTILNNNLKIRLKNYTFEKYG